MRHVIHRGAPRARPRRRRVGDRHAAAYAACGWSVVFIAPHVYWAAGGTAGLPQGQPPQGTIAAINYAAIVLSAAAGAVALKLARPPGRSVARIVLAAAWTASVLLGLRGASGLVHGLIEGGEWSDHGPDALVIGFEALFLLGGILFGFAARDHVRHRSARGTP